MNTYPYHDGPEQPVLALPPDVAAGLRAIAFPNWPTDGLPDETPGLAVRVGATRAARRMLGLDEETGLERTP